MHTNRASLKTSAHAPIATTTTRSRVTLPHYIESNPTMDLMKMLAATLGQPKRPFKKRTLSSEAKDAPAGGELPKDQA